MIKTVFQQIKHGTLIRGNTLVRLPYRFDSIAPFNNTGTTGKACAKACCQYGHAGLNHARFQCITHSQRYCCCGGVGIFINNHNNLFHGEIKTLSQGLNNTNIGLMRNKQIDILSRQALSFEYVSNGIAHSFNRTFKYFLAFKVKRDKDILSQMQRRHTPTR